MYWGENTYLDIQQAFLRIMHSACCDNAIMLF